MTRKYIAAALTLAALSAGTWAFAQSTPGFGHSYSIGYLTQENVQLQNGQSLGQLKDVVIDLVSGRTLYAVVPSGGTLHAVPTELFAAAPSGKNLVLNTTAQQIQSAPVVSGSNIGNNSYIAQVYQHFNVPAWWGPTATGRENATFGNPQWANTLRGREVDSSSGAKLGTVDNVMVDLQNGRVPFFTLSTAQGGQQQSYPVPPMAFTYQNRKFSTGIDQNKLKGAPKLTASTAQQMQDPNFAAQVYQYYGKQQYWQTPTSSQPTSRIYPQIGPGATNK